MSLRQVNDETTVIASMPRVKHITYPGFVTNVAVLGLADN
jgi:hypothetical protein